jgi:hypothetical protein
VVAKEASVMEVAEREVSVMVAREVSVVKCVVQQH